MNALQLLVPWHPSPTVVVLTVGAGWLYWRGCGIEQPSFARQFSYWAGLVLLYLAIHTQLDYYAEREFFVHRIQQTALRDFGPFLLVLARPGAVLWAGMPAAWRDRWFRPVGRSRLYQLLRAIFRNPLLNGVLFVGLTWLWLIPIVHFYAMLDVRLYRLMNWSMIADGLLFWSLVLDDRPSPPARLKAGFRIVLVMAVMPLELAPGVVITFATTNLYPLYELCGRAFAGVSALQDQTIGGLIIWVGGSMMNVIGALSALYFGFFQDERVEKTARAVRAPATPPVG